MKAISYAGAIALAASLPCWAGTTEYDLNGGFHAVGYPAIATGAKGQSYAYSVRGGTMLQAKDGKRLRVSIDCAGFDSADESGATTGLGRCAWAETDGDKLFVSLQTKEGGNAYTVTGGTGKWAGASGGFTTKFTYLPSPNPELYLGVEEGSGRIVTVGH